ncbi:MAG: hypothetical protein B6U77_00155 [Candidatus Hecatellales archaeon ex4484_218]|nr:MAG: hypothetical protein B6U77_00155 [Candidatus Hecatellales archaeon ex4484_218]
MKQKKIGFILVSLAGACYGSSGVLGKMLMNTGLQPETVVMYRVSLGFLILATAFLILNPTSLKVKLEKIPYLMVCGIVGVVVGILTYFYAVKLISASIAVILLYTYPVFALVLAKIFVGERITALKIFAATLVLVGCFLTVKGYSLTYLKLTGLGVVFGLISGFSYSIYMVLSKIMLKDVNESAVIFYTLGFGSLVLLLINFFNQSLLVSLELDVWVLIVLIAIIPTTLAFTFLIFGLKYLEAGRASIYSTFEIVSAILLAFIFLGERLEIFQGLGAILVVFSIFLIYWK